MKKIAVLGPIPYDHITTAKGQEIEKYGCVTHPVIGLAKLLKGQGEVLPIAHIRQEDYEAVEELFAPIGNIRMEGILTEKDQGDVIELKFVDQNNRLEKQTAFMPPIGPEDVAPFLDCDIFVGVPITDYEVPLATLRYIKENTSHHPLIIFDAHGPTTVATTTGHRLRRFWVERDLWLPYIDVLKMNIEEAGCCWFKKEFDASELNETYQELTEDEMDALAKYVLERGVKALYITLDSRGCMVYHQTNGTFEKQFVPSVKVDEVIDTTGCGDSFAGGLAYGLIDDASAYVRAAQYANALGARRTQGTTFDVFWALEATQDLIRQNYGIDTAL
ncbi:MAG: PfkB family carbohydrate kinase [Bacteroidota bacterium]